MIVESLGILGQAGTQASEDRTIWLVVAGLVLVAVALTALTVRYWIVTRPTGRSGGGGRRVRSEAEPAIAVEAVTESDEAEWGPAESGSDTSESDESGSDDSVSDEEALDEQTPGEQAVATGVAAADNGERDTATDLDNVEPGPATEDDPEGPGPVSETPRRRVGRLDSEQRRKVLEGHRAGASDSSG